MDIKVIVATHKKYQIPSDEMYMPIHVGAEGKPEIFYTPDNTGENISEKNPMFCELTGLYWAWKNLDVEYLGLAHYRRHFKGKGKGDVFHKVLTKKEAEKILANTDIIVPKKRHYVIETIYSHYDHTLYVETLDTTRDIIKEMTPEYLEAFDKCMKHRSMHAFNMFIMKKEKLDEYLSWLYKVLFELEERLKDKDYSTFHKRYPGRIGELMLDVWITKNGYTYEEVPYQHMEPVKYIKKLTMFLNSKIFKKKYEQSI